MRLASRPAPETPPTAQQTPVAAEAAPPPDTPPRQDFKTQPKLTGKLAQHLAKQTPRTIAAPQPPFHSNRVSWTIDDSETMAAVGVALTLAFHITSFAHSIISQPHLERARNELMRCFSARDAVRLEVEAYDLINWFAGVMNETWRMSQAPIQNFPPAAEPSEVALIGVLERAVSQKKDLVMRYYTGSRGEFSERTVSPIQVVAEKYLIAFCHMRQEERVFRLTRIIQLSPTDENADDADAYRFPKPKTAVKKLQQKRNPDNPARGNLFL